jgi:cell division GTPase FtsZ
MTFDESMEDEVKVTIIATGFEEQSKETILKTPKRDMLGRSIKRESENFITRLTKQETSTSEMNEPEIDLDAEEDIETPAFIRRSLNK